MKDLVNKTVKSFVALSACFIILCLPHMGYTQIWTGATDDLTLGGSTGNWNSEATPTNTDTAEFKLSGVTSAQVSTTTTSSTFNPLNVQFDNAASPYTLTVDGNNVGPGSAVFTIGNGTTGAVINNSTAMQTIRAIQGGMINFLSGSSASPFSNQHDVFYFAGSNNSDAVSSIVLTDAYAGEATFLLNLLPTYTQPARLDFKGTSNAEKCSITAQSKSIITFTDSANVDQAFIQLSDSSLIFNTTTTSSSASINMFANSSMTLSKNIIISDIPFSDSTSAINLNSNKLTIANPEYNIIDGVIIGTGGILEKQGSISLTLTNTNNSYTGGTIITDGTLLVETTTLPPAPVTIQANGTLDFYQNGGTFGGNIVNNGNLTATTASPVTLSGAISGSGTLTVLEDITLAGTNSYIGQTIVSGTLHTKAVNLPSNAPIVGQGGSSLVEFLSSSPETYSGVMSGTAKLLMSGSSSLHLTGVNTYTGGTEVDSGVLIASTYTLPQAALEPSITITGTGIFDFYQTAAGSFYGDVLIDSSTSSLQTDGTAPITLLGTLSGDGKLNVNSGYTILANTANTYMGGTQVSGGTLQTTVATLPTSNKKINILNGTLIFRETVDETYSEKILAGSGILQKEGAATLTLTGDNTGFGGTTKVLQGRLALLSTLGGNVLVDTGGILSGTGQIRGSLNVHNGTVAPGASIGTLTVNGNYQQDLLGIYEVEIDGTGQSDLITVGGSASLSGTLIVYSVDGIVDLTQTYTILHADGEVSGQFIQITSNLPGYIPVVSYGRQDVFLNLQHVLTMGASTHNQQTIAQHLLNITNPTSEESAIIDRLNALSSNPNTLDEARRALDQISGEQYSNIQLTAELAGRQFLRRLFDPLRTLLAFDPFCPTEDCCTPYQDGSMEYPFQKPSCSFDDTRGLFWASVGGGRTFLRHDSNASGFNADSYDINVGIQNTIYDNLTLGIAAGYQHDKINYNIGGSGNGKVGLLGIYTLYNPQAFYLLSDIVLEGYSCTIKRSIDIDDLHYKAKGKPRVFQGTFYGEVGKRIGMERFQVMPFVGVEVDYFQSRSFKEHGANPINLLVKNRTRCAAFSRLGLHLAAADVCSFLSFDIDLAWQCRLTSSENHIKDNFSSFGNGFKIFGINLPRNCLEGTANVGFKICDNCFAFLEVTGQRWERLSSWNVTAGFSIDW